MKQLKKAVAYLLCGALLLGNLGNIVSSASAKADNFDSLVSADASKDADKSDASKDADKNDASENTMNDLVSVTSVTYDKTSYAPGEKAEVNIKLSSLNPSDIANQMITVKFFNKTSTYSIFGNLIWDSSASCFSGNVDIPVTALKDDYYIRYVSYLLLKENCAYSVYISNSNITALSVGEAVSEDILVESIVLPEESISLIKGASKTINASVAPENASDKTLKYTSSKPSVATVDRKGVVKALKKGSATITIEAQDGSNWTPDMGVLIRVQLIGIEDFMKGILI